ncbi:MAG: hypothetical protein JMN24_05680 [gamma proteobacterium endosymbiont of Lamellibrachia anaximandri]|nr:hypothetical protein [gamma proteobacterium endosymbiont of Lamellibrachia anaximandri]
MRDKKTLRVRDLSVAGWRIYLEFERWRVNCPRCNYKTGSENN